MKRNNVDIRFTVTTDQAGRQVLLLDGKIDRLGTSTLQTERKVRRGFRGMSSASAKFLGKLGVAGGIAGVVFSLGKMASASIATGAAFEQSMARVGALTQATESEFQTLEAQARQLGATTVFSATEAAEGMQFLAMAGFNTNEIVTAMPGLLAQAAAGQIDLGTAADITSNVLSGFNLAATESSRVADVLTKASISSNTTIQGLGDTMKFVAPVAASLGIEMEELAAAAGIMGDAGIQASQAGTSLRASLLQLTSPSKNQIGVMNQLGFSLTRADGSTKSLAEIVGDLEGKTRSMSDAQRTSTLATLVGQEAASGFTALIARGSGELSKFTGELRDAGGTAEEVANKQLDTFQGAMKLLDSTLDDLKISLFETFDDELKGLIQFAIGLIQRFKDDLVALFRFVVVNGGAAFRTFQAVFEIVFNNFGDILFNTVRAIPQMFKASLQVAGANFIDFVAFIRDQLGNVADLFEGLGMVIVSAFTGDRAGFKEGLEQMKESFVATAEDVVELGQKMGENYREAFKGVAESIFAGIDTSALDEALAKFISLQQAKNELNKPDPAAPSQPVGDTGNPVAPGGAVSVKQGEADKIANIEKELTATLRAEADERLEIDGDLYGDAARRSREEFTQQHVQGVQARIEAEKSLAEAQKAALAQAIGTADTSIQTAGDAANAIVGSVRQVIQAKIGEAIAKAIASIPFPFNLIGGGAAATGINLLFNKLVPSFAQGVEDFKGGLAMVHRDEMLVNLAPGTSVIPRAQTKQIIQQTVSAQLNPSSGFGSAVNDQTGAIMAGFQALGDRIERMEIGLDLQHFRDEMGRLDRHKKTIGNTA